MENLENQQPIQENYSAQEKGLRMVARALSAIFPPFMVPFYSVLLLFLFTYLSVMPLPYKAFILGVVYLFTVCFPMLAIFLYQKIFGKGIKDLKQKEKRYIPYALTIISYCACVIILYRMYVPRYLSGIIVATIFAMILCGLINFKCKVSTHVACCGMMIGGLLSYSFILQFNPIWWLCGFILLSGLLGSARIILEQHTLTEVIVGFIAGMFCGIIGILFI
ncbi:MAG: phosphatase PAP2 family protein [Bacteroidaceae bacterium]|nr:phosphatase PAP2 family protein [Bacteroidaceae bacterium]MBQ8888716.1 phosphatase PAP2 family protein [Bacteroidaceae bacterium]